MCLGVILRKQFKISIMSCSPVKLRTVPKVMSTCTLKPLDNAYESISIPHKNPIILGRNPFTKVTDKRCSRTQVQVEADLELQQVRVSHVGANLCGVNGLALEQKSSIVLKHNDTIELILGYFIYRIEFDPAPSEANEQKRRLTDSEDHDAKKPRKNSDGEEKVVEGLESTIQTNSPPQPAQEGWENIHQGKLLIYSSHGCLPKSKIAAFDMDGTLICTKSGKVFPKSYDDWKLSFPVVSKKLKKLWDDGYKVVILTNQAGIGKGKVNVTDFKRKVELIVEKLDIPIQVFVSTGKGIYRKPAPGMWYAVIEKNGRVPVNVTESFYCGDAAGRPVNWAPKKKKDFSNADRLLALNLKLKFYTPEEFFLGERAARFDLPEFIPSQLKSDAPVIEPPGTDIVSDLCEVAVLVGAPGSGKSHFAKTYLVDNGYHHVNRDTLGSWQKCISELERGLVQGKSVIVDNTNPDKESRKRYVAMAKKHCVPCRCFVFTTSVHHAKHNNRFRELTDDTHQEITDMVINSYMKKYQEPTPDEEFDAIVKVNCVPKFTDKEKEKLYKMFLLEK